MPREHRRVRLFLIVAILAAVLAAIILYWRLVGSVPTVTAGEARLRLGADEA